jgi:hypothetical protein
MEVMKTILYFISLLFIGVWGTIIAGCFVYVIIMYSIMLIAFLLSVTLMMVEPIYCIIGCKKVTVNGAKFVWSVISDFAREYNL